MGSHRLWEEVVPQDQEEVPEDLDYAHACSEELMKVPRLRRCHPDTAGGGPVLDVPGRCLKVRHADVLILADVVAGRLAGSTVGQLQKKMAQSY